MNEIKIKDPLTKKDRIVPNELGFVTMEMNDFTAEMQLTGKFCQRLTDYCRENGKHCYLTAHRRVEFEKKAKTTDPDVIKSIGPGFTGKTFPDEVIGLFDLIWCFETVGEGSMIDYKAMTVGSTSKIAKTCFPGLFKQFEILTIGHKDAIGFQDIIKRVKESIPR